MFDIDEKIVEIMIWFRIDFENGFFLVNVLLCDFWVIEYDKIYLVFEYVSGNMCVIDVFFFEDNDDYMWFYFLDSLVFVYRIVVDKVGVFLVVLCRIDWLGWNLVVIMIMDME